MKPSTLLLAQTIAFTAFAHAADYTVEPKPFKIETTLNAVFLPTTVQPIRIKPEVWTSFTITQLVPQGATVKKGDTLIGIDTRKLDKHIAATTKARKSAALNLAQAKHDLAQLEISTPRRLADFARSEKQTAEDLAWFTRIGHAKEIEDTKRSVKRAELSLLYQKEELKQLEKMYGEDQKIEETEEIILTRTRNAVERAEYALKAAKINADYALKTGIPRKLKNMQLAAENARIANASAQKNLPRALEQKRLAVAKAIRDDAEAEKNLAKLKDDRAMMNITAPADGIVYYGSMEHGRWSPATALKVLKVGARLPANTTLMSFIPSKTPLILSAFAAEKSLAGLTKNASGYAISNLNRYRNFPVTLTQLSKYPETDGTYALQLKPTIPANLHIVPGMKATARITTHRIDKALKIPSEYLTRADNGTYTVNVKLADGKTAKRKVSVGASNNKWVIITQGLEKGQVIVK